MDRRYGTQQRGAALLIAICITTLCTAIALHALSISLNQDQAIHCEVAAFQERQVQAHYRAIERRKRHSSSLSQFLADDKITLIDWVPDHLEADCDTGVFLYTVTGEITDSPAETPVYYRRRYEPDVSMRLKAEKYKYQQQAFLADYLLVAGVEGNIKKITIEKDPRWTALSGRLKNNPCSYALTTAGELRIYDAKQDRLLRHYALGEQIIAAQPLDLNPNAWEGYLVTHTVVESQVVRQILWVALQHPNCPDVMLWSLDISDPNGQLSGLNNSISSVHTLPDQRLSARPIGMMHPQHHQGGIVLAAVRGKVPVLQWFERGASGPETWSNHIPESHLPWNRMMAIDRWQVGCPDRLYVFDTAGRILKGDFFSGLSRQPLNWRRLYDKASDDRIKQVKAVSGIGDSVDIVQEKLLQDKTSIVSVVSDK